MHKEGREHASFLALIIDAATKVYPPPTKSTEIRCMKNDAVVPLRLMWIPRK